MRVEKEIHGEFPCFECGRTARAKIRKKYPARDTAPKFVCGYHLRSRMTSEFVVVKVVPPSDERKIPLGYAPEGT